MPIDDIHTLFKDKLKKIIDPIYGADIGMFQLAVDAVNDGESTIDAIARHMCAALVEPRDDHGRKDETGGNRHY
jgi:hypothetical protein